MAGRTSLSFVHVAPAGKYEALDRIDVGRRIENATEHLQNLFDLHTKMTKGKNSA